MRPDGDPSLLRFRIRQGGDGGHDRGNVGGLEHLAAGQLRDFLQYVEAGGAASLLQGGALDRDHGLQWITGLGAGQP